MDEQNDGFGPLFWGALIIGIIGLLGFLATAGVAVTGG